MSFGRFRQQFASHWDDPLFQQLDGTSHSYAETWCTARALAESWQSRGIMRGETIACRNANGYEMPCFYLACLIGGYVACPVVPTLRQDNVDENLELIRPSLFLDHDLALPAVKPDKKPDEPQWDAIDYTGRFLIMFSSGSTGRNKAICHSFRSVSGSASAFADLSGFDNQTRLYHVLPMTYMAGFLNSMLAVIMAGGQIVEGPQFSMETVADFWRHPLSTDANTLSVIPPLAAAVCRLTRDPGKIARVREQFRIIQCTSQAIQKDLRQQFMEKFSVPLRDCYGMTELGGPLSIQQQEDAEAMNDFSVPLPALDLQIRDGGELWIRSPFAMLGYLQDGLLNSPFDDGGYLNTGDLACIESGRLEITGRVKDIIIRGGINTSPARIESVMSQMPAISEVSVVGLPHAFWGEEIVACVVAETEDTGAILSWCRNHLAPHEVPDRIRFMTSFPRSFIGKVLKRDLTKVLEN